MEYQKIREMLHEHFKGLLENCKQRIASQGRLTEMDKTALHNSKGYAKDALKHGDYTFAGSDADLAGLIDNYALPIKSNTQQYSTLRSEFLKAFRDYCSDTLKYDASLENYSFSDTEKADNQPRNLKVKKMADSLNTYYEEKLRLKEWREHIADDYRNQFDLLLRYLGKDASLHISPELASDVKNMLLRCPKNMNKKISYRDKSITELITMNIPAIDRMSPVTVSKYIRTYSTFYDWVVKRKETNENNFASLVDNTKKVQLDREPFSPEDVQRIYPKVLAAKKPHHRWGSLIAFYTGARLNEIAQLESSDIILEDGVWCFRFTDEGEYMGELKRLKNDSSKRLVPIHSYLLNLGFLDFVKENEGQLFKGLTYHKKDGYGRNLGRWFNDSLLRKQLTITSPALVFHSIRHTVAQQLRNKDVFEATLKDILGHTQAGVTLQVYAGKLKKRVMQEAIEKLDYS